MLHLKNRNRHLYRHLPERRPRRLAGRLVDSLLVRHRPRLHQRDRPRPMLCLPVLRSAHPCGCAQTWCPWRRRTGLHLRRQTLPRCLRPQAVRRPREALDPEHALNGLCGAAMWTCSNRSSRLEGIDHSSPHITTRGNTRYDVIFAYLYPVHYRFGRLNIRRLSCLTDSLRYSQNRIGIAFVRRKQYCAFT